MDCTDLVIGSARRGYSRIGDYYTRDRSTPVHDEYLGGRNDLTAALVWEEGEHTFMLFRKKLTCESAPLFVARSSVRFHVTADCIHTQAHIHSNSPHHQTIHAYTGTRTHGEREGVGWHGGK